MSSQRKYIVHVENGSLDTFKCTYHGWEYDTEGVLRNLQDPEDFDDGNPCGKIKLKEIHCEVALGFVWITLLKSLRNLKKLLIL